jgi:hypothetical protein
VLTRHSHLPDRQNRVPCPDQRSWQPSLEAVLLGTLRTTVALLLTLAFGLKLLDTTEDPPDGVNLIGDGGRGELVLDGGREETRVALLTFAVIYDVLNSRAGCSRDSCDLP